MTRPVTRGSKEFLNEMLARYSGTLANVSSLKARPLFTKTGYLLCCVIIYHTEGLNIIHHGRIRFHILQQDTFFGGGKGGDRIFIEYDVGQKNASKHVLKPSGTGEKLLKIHVLSVCRTQRPPNLISPSSLS
jgi:hypothetical protein